MNKWRGLKDLIQQGVDAGATALEKVQKDTAAVPFAIVEAVPGIGAAAKVVHEIHDQAVSLTYAAVRGVNGAVGKGLDVVIDRVESGRGDALVPSDEGDGR